MASENLPTVIDGDFSDWVEEGAQDNVPPPSNMMLPVAVGPAGIKPKLNLLKKPSQGVRVRSRAGRGGNIQYIDWTTAADLFDDVFGPGQWQLDIYKLQEFLRFKYDNGQPDATKPITEVVAWCVFRAPGVMPFHVFGHGHHYQYDDSSSKADAIESALSRAHTKAAARLSSFVRPLWAAKDRQADIQGIAQAGTGVSMGVKMMVEQLKNSGRGGYAQVYLDTHNIDLETIELAPQASVIKWQQELAKLMTMPLDGEGEGVEAEDGDKE